MKSLDAQVVIDSSVEYKVYESGVIKDVKVYGLITLEALIDAMILAEQQNLKHPKDLVRVDLFGGLANKEAIRVEQLCEDEENYEGYF